MLSNRTYKTWFSVFMTVCWDSQERGHDGVGHIGFGHPDGTAKLVRRAKRQSPNDRGTETD